MPKEPQHRVRVRLDRLQLVSRVLQTRTPPRLDGFEVTRDSFVRCQTTTATYARCRQFKSLTNDMKIYWQYAPQKAWLASWKITIVSDDLSGLSRDEIEPVLKHCRGYRLLLVEVAIDFSPSAGVNRQFIRRQAVFGKSHRLANKRDEHLYYGSRKSDKLVRCYEKSEVGSYRVELELHSGLLRRNGICVLDDLVHLPDLVHPKHLQFVALEWNRLSRHLARKLGDRSDGVIAGARRRTPSILRLQRYLRRKGVFNTHRFLTPRAVNNDVKRALNTWIRKFNRE